MASALTAALPLVLLGCAVPGGAVHTATSPGAATPGVPQATTAGPGAVATSYLHAVMEADFAAASTYVNADQRDVIKALGLSAGPGTLEQVSGDVSVGRLDVQGETATVVFVGRLCRVSVGVAGPAASTATDCVENRDAAAQAPVFTVHLAHGPAGWQVALPTPDND